MTRSDMDNDLARLLGPDAIPDEERSSIMARLAADDEALSQAADAAAVLRELEAEDGIMVVDETAHDGPPRVRDAEPAHDPKVVTLPPPSTRRAWRRPPARWLALAAVLVAALLVLPPRFGGRGADDTAKIAMLLDDHRLPSEWTDSATGPVTRSASDNAPDDARAARLGALQLRLELAIASRQLAETQRLSGQIEESLEHMTAGGTVSPIYRAMARDSLPHDSLTQLLADGREGLTMFLDADHFTLGAWAEAARIAAYRRDVAFFRARASRRMVDRAASLPSLDDTTRISVDALRAAGQTDAEWNWPTLQAHAKQLLVHLATPTSADAAGVPSSWAP